MMRLLKKKRLVITTISYWNRKSSSELITMCIKTGNNFLFLILENVSKKASKTITYYKFFFKTKCFIFYPYFIISIGHENCNLTVGIILIFILFHVILIQTNICRYKSNHLLSYTTHLHNLHKSTRGAARLNLALKGRGLWRNQPISV